MTREEAAQLLWRVAHDKYGPDDNPMRQREAADIVVTALRGSADKTKEFCMMANQCVVCGAEMPEGDHVCKGCRDSMVCHHALNVRITTEQMASINRRKTVKQMGRNLYSETAENCTLRCDYCGRFTKDSDLTDYWICKRCKEKRT